MPSREAFRFFHGFRVRYSEIDGQGVVFNAHYLTYFDTAITEYLRELGWDYRKAVSERGLDFHAVKAVVEYRAPIGFDALIDVGVRAERIGRSSLTWGIAVFERGDTQASVHGEIVWVCARTGTHTSHPLPEDLVELLKASDAESAPSSHA